MTTDELKSRLTKQPVMYVDGTPDKDYPLRILEAYRKNCDVRWVSQDTDNELFAIMNEHCEQRAQVLDQAIALLKSVR